MQHFCSVTSVIAIACWLVFTSGSACVALAQTVKVSEHAEPLELNTEVPSGPFFADKDTDPRPAATRWQSVKELSDEFDGDVIDDVKWQTNPAQNGWTWIGRPPGLFKAENVSVSDGAMKVVVSPLPKPQKIGRKSFLYQGAIVRSKTAGEPGWYYETRMKANATEMSSTFWLMTPGGSKKRLELDIQECVGRVSDNAEEWARSFDQIFHSNLIQRMTRTNPKVQTQGSVQMPSKNHEKFHVYGCWWRPDEAQFFLDGKHVYSIKPNVVWDAPAHLQMAIETYDWNPVPANGGLVASGTQEQRTTSYDWIRVWKLEPLETGK